MKITYEAKRLNKRFPLRISRGLVTGSDNLFVTVHRNGVSGIGEMAPGKIKGANTPASSQQTIEAFHRTDIDDLSITEVFDKAIDFGIPKAALAALDIALWDCKAKEAGMPLYKLLGFPLPQVPTSVTIGINPPAVVKERVPLLLDGTGIKSLKIKLGSTEGTEADKEMFSQVYESTRGYDVQLRVDANGGWTVSDANDMIPWLKDRDVDYIEQPLPEGQEEDLEAIYHNRALPIYVDESCRMSTDIPKWYKYVDGVNMKLMKCGGITEALRIIATAKAFGLKTMIGCMGESSVSISAGAALSGCIDHIDLDSHLNLDPDPYTGAEMINGVITPTSRAGHGAILKSE